MLITLFLTACTTTLLEKKKNEESNHFFNLFFLLSAHISAHPVASQVSDRLLPYLALGATLQSLVDA